MNNKKDFKLKISNEDLPKCNPIGFIEKENDPYKEINILKIHEAIRNSNVYISLFGDNDEEEIINIEEKHLFDSSILQNLSLDNIVDVLNKCKFWNIEYLPYEVLSFCFEKQKFIQRYLY